MAIAATSVRGVWCRKVAAETVSLRPNWAIGRGSTAGPGDCLLFLAAALLLLPDASASRVSQTSSELSRALSYPVTSRLGSTGEKATTLHGRGFRTFR